MLLAAKTMAATTLNLFIDSGYCKNANKSISKLRTRNRITAYPEKRDTVTFKITTTTQTQKRGMPMSMSSIPSSSQSGKLMAGSKELVTRFPILFCSLSIDYRTHGDDGNFVGLWRQCENPTDGTPVVVKNLLSVEGLHGFYPMLLKTLAVLLHLVRSCAGFRCRSGGARRLTASANGKMASHVNARYASYMVLFIAFSATFLPMRR